jgi:ArsR family transcriptional regulator
MSLFLTLRTRERCVAELVTTAGLPQPLVSHHLRILTDAGLATVRRSEGFRLYAVSPAGLSEAAAMITDLLDPALPADALPGGNTECCHPGR